MTDQELELISTIRSSDNPTEALRYALMLLVTFQDRASKEQDTELGLQGSTP
jgi:hypothetical protein